MKTNNGQYQWQHPSIAPSPACPGCSRTGPVARKHGAFTLIELLIVIAIILFLAALLAFCCLAVSRTQTLPQDSGASGAWQKIQKVRTTASVLHGTAHPDDENGGVLAKLSRKDGARVVLMTLTRGESGDNAVGPQLFEGLALIRTDELGMAGPAQVCREIGRAHV